jgi:N,N'-diacetyllegionaminate synthase
LKRIEKGDKLTEENIGIKRPGTGLSPMRWYQVIGGTASKDFAEDELIEL